MPEGDTIHRTAATLRRALAGRRLVRFDAPRLRFRPFPDGTVVTGVEARGKHCLVHFDDGRTLRTHMMMTGSWHLYRPGERWQKKPAAARAVVEVEGWVAVCFAAPVVELVEGDAAPEHLGPDLCSADADLEAAVELLGRLSPPDREIGDALLDQRIACGVGNVYKSEVCFALGIDPFTPVGALSGDERSALISTAARLLQDNLGTARRTTVPDGEGGGLFVYGRRDRPCRRCGTTIAWARQGAHARGTYWCPTCQPPPGAPVRG